MISHHESLDLKLHPVNISSGMKGKGAACLNLAGAPLENARAPLIVGPNASCPSELPGRAFFFFFVYNFFFYL